MLESYPCRTEPSVYVRLYMAMPKAEKLELIVQKAVELGVGEIIPVLTRRCVSRPDPKSFEKKRVRLTRIAAEAAKPEQTGPHSPGAGDDGPAPGSGGDGQPVPAPCCSMSAARAPMREVLDRIEGEASLLIGAEGGFDESEVELALSMGIPSLTLGPRILRCETAPMAALSVLMYHTGNMN